MLWFKLNPLILAWYADIKHAMCPCWWLGNESHYWLNPGFQFVSVCALTGSKPIRIHKFGQGGCPGEGSSEVRWASPPWKFFSDFLGVFRKFGKMLTGLAFCLKFWGILLYTRRTRFNPSQIEHWKKIMSFSKIWMFSSIWDEKYHFS